jgi:hypothetical protein
MILTMKLKVVFTCLAIAFGALTAFFASGIRPATAMDLQGRGDIIFLGGSIKPGDAIQFAQFVKNAPKGSYHGVYLASGGGFVLEAVEIGRIIRQEGLATIVDAGHAVCASACTAIFASGTKRVYLNAMNIADGLPKKACAGLGFHNGSTANSLDANHYSGQASALMIDAFYEFGVPRAAELITKAQPNEIYQLSGQTALAIGIATSVGKL